MPIENLRIGVPEGFLIPRLYLYSFLSVVETSKREAGGHIILESEDMAGSIISGLKTVKDVIEERRGDEGLRRLRLDTLPMSGNDKSTFRKLCLELKCELDPISILEAYESILRSEGVDRLKRGLERFSIGKGGYSLPSIFKPELYKLTRASFFKDGFALNPRTTSDFLVFMMAGFLLSRVARARIDEKTWISVLVLPSRLAWSRSSWFNVLSSLSGFWDGVKPTDALILYLLGTLWQYLKENPQDTVILGMTDPAGSKPASISIDIDAPLGEILERCSSLLDPLLEKEWARNIVQRLARKSLNPTQTGRELAERLVKLLFTTLQGDTRSLEELILLSSRLEAALSAIKQPEKTEKEMLNIARDARKIAQEILIHHF